MKINDLPAKQGIYCICFPNNKIYIGLAQNIHSRIKQHINKTYERPDLPISRAIQKYGIEEVEILELCEGKDRTFLCEREQYWIKKYNAQDPTIGYNISPGGDGANPGWENQQAKFTQESLYELYELLEFSDETMTDLAHRFNVTRETITKINDGSRYTQPDRTYPIRGKRVFAVGLNNKQDSFYHREEELEQLIYELKYTKTPMSHLADKYKIKKTTISLINQGKKYWSEAETYPLRPTFSKLGGNKRIFSLEELEDIKKDLLNKQYSMKTIAEKYHCNRSLISQVNAGTRQHQPSWQYPIRKTIK